MRWGAAIGVLLSLAGVILLGLATFCVPYNNNMWLFAIHGFVEVHCGVLGYSKGGDPSDHKLGYDIGADAALGVNTGSYFKPLTYAFVLFPIGFGISILSTLLGLISMFLPFFFGWLASLCAFLAMLVTVAGFAIVIALYFFVKNDLSQMVTIGFGSAFWVAIAGTIVLLLASFFLGTSCCCDGKMGRKPKHHRRSQYDRMFAAPYPTQPAPPQEAIPMHSYQQPVPAFYGYDPQKSSSFDTPNTSFGNTSYGQTYPSTHEVYGDPTFPTESATHLMQPGEYHAMNYAGHGAHAASAVVPHDAQATTYAPLQPEQYTSSGTQTPSYAMGAQASNWFLPNAPQPPAQNAGLVDPTALVPHAMPSAQNERSMAARRAAQQEKAPYIPS
ncbi:hypothetical protein MVES1_000433 [Malassezia vespertilionis]|uniref:uncharacterized protein n=1 Tax=Malassezia vespertilionis TaxID=2020962 RepID=UPI0024B2437D|nr:uncharacterized protein MVES1_000433 [Malassezia vespertilionis]WFD05107.1 hypothetical protein MVES1_000433 [Malassezia vespertilionis]